MRKDFELKKKLITEGKDPSAWDHSWSAQVPQVRVKIIDSKAFLTPDASSAFLMMW